MSRIRCLLASHAVSLACLVVPATALAQDRPPTAVVELAAGALGFPDDGGTVNEGFIGGAVRFHLTPRISVGPEIAFVNGDGHSHLMLTGNVTIDVIGPDAGAPPKITPFVVMGAGLFQTSEHFRFDEFTHTEGSFTAGGGVRAAVGRRVTVGGEVRIGWELHLRYNALVGVRLGR
jgi:hypothetical protein